MPAPLGRSSKFNTWVQASATSCLMRARAEHSLFASSVEEKQYNMSGVSIVADDAHATGGDLLPTMALARLRNAESVRADRAQKLMIKLVKYSNYISKDTYRKVEVSARAVHA